MEKTIFILREPIWIYNDEPWYDYRGVNEIYRKYNTYHEALEEKNKLNIQIARNHQLLHGEFSKYNYFQIATQKNTFSYFKEHFGIDWERIWDDSLVNKSKVTEWEFDCLVNNFIIPKILQNDKHILYLLDIIELNFYEIAEVKETDVFYKIYSNAHFSDFLIFDERGCQFIGEEREIGYHEFGQGGLYYTSSIEIKNKICNMFYWHLSDTFYDDEKKYLKGSLSNLSEAPEMLKSYIENYADYFVYDAENQTLAMNHILDDETMYEVMRGFVALLRPEKVPFIIKSFPISEIPEKYKEEERRQAEERQKAEVRRQENQSDLLSGNIDLPF